MDQDDMEQGFRNLDRRVERVEQILPTLATKDDLQAAIKPLATKAELRAAIDKAVEPLATKAELRAAVRPLATKAELRTAIDEAVAPLATKAELQGAIGGAEGRMRTHFDVVTESLRDDVRLIAAGMADLSQRMDQLRGELKTDIAVIDRRLMRVEARGASR